MQGKWGFVKELGPKGTVKVTFPEDGDLPSGWLVDLQHTTGADKTFSTRKVGDRVFCLVDENAEEGVIIGGGYGGDNEPPTESADVWVKQFEDGTVVQYDKAAHKLTATIAEDGTAEVTAKEVKVIGDLVVTGDITAQADVNVAGKVTAEGDVQSSGDITTMLGEVQAGPIKLKTHLHLGNLGAPTGPSMPG